MWSECELAPTATRERERQRVSESDVVEFTETYLMATEGSRVGKLLVRAQTQVLRILLYSH